MLSTFQYTFLKRILTLPFRLLRVPNVPPSYPGTPAPIRGNAKSKFDPYLTLCRLAFASPLITISVTLRCWVTFVPRRACALNCPKTWSFRFVTPGTRQVKATLVRTSDPLTSDATQRAQSPTKNTSSELFVL
jgi:hypothetical protein